MKIIFIGPPGSGKGTQANFIENKFKIPKISIGDILRYKIKNKSILLINKINNLIKSGCLINDDIIISLLKKRISKKDCSNGFLLDGFPRTILQAKNLDTIGIKIDIVIIFNISDKTIIKRITGRRIHENSGRIYNIYYNKPNIRNIDNITKEKLVQRIDDNKHTIIKRLNIYKNNIKLINQYYFNKFISKTLFFYQINANKSINNIKKKLSKIIKSNFI